MGDIEMAIANLMELKTCTKCGESYPATTEHFYSQKRSSDGLKSECKYCSREARNKSYSRKKRELEKEKGRWCSKCKKYYKPVEEHFYTEDGQPGRWCIRCNDKQREDNHKKIEWIYEDLKAKYSIGKAFKIKNQNTEQWEWAKVIGIYKHFIKVKTKHYQTSIAWRDILTGHTKVREG